MYNITQCLQTKQINFLVTEVDVEADEEETITETSISRSASKPADHLQKKRRGSSIECH